MNDRDYSARLESDVKKWVEEGIIDNDAAAAISSRYPSEPDTRRSRAGGMIALLGALLIGAGAIAFIASNWSAISPLAKLAFLIGLLISVATVGYRLRFGKSTLKGTGSALLFLTTPLYGACIFLTASSFQMPVDTPELLFLWAAGVLPVAIITESRAQWLVSLLVLIVAIGWTTSLWMPETNFWLLNVLFCFGVAIHGGSALLDKLAATQRFKQITELTGLLLIQVLLIPLGFTGLLDALETHGLQDKILVWIPALVVIPALLVTSMAYIKSARTAADKVQLCIYAAGIFVVMSPLLITAMSAAVLAALVNALMLVIVIALIVSGYHERNPVAINVAVVGFVIQVGCRYGELFWGHIPPEVFFTILGIMLLLGGMFLERGRKRLLKGMRDDASLREVSG